MANVHPLPLAAAAPADAMLEIGTVGAWQDKPLLLDLQKVLSARMLIQGASGAGKSSTLRKIIEEAFDYVTVMIVDPDGEFHNLAAHIGATTLRGAELSGESLMAAAIRARKHRVALHLDLSDLDAEELINRAAAFFAGLMGCDRDDWGNTILVAIDEAHRLAPHMAASARDAETRRLGIAALADLVSGGRKRGIATLVATQRLAKLAASVTAELQTVLIGACVFDRDVARAAQSLGFTSAQSDQLRHLDPGQFYAFGPALSRTAVLAKISAPVTVHTGAAPDLVGPADLTLEQADQLLDLDALRSAPPPATAPGRGGVAAVDRFMLDPSATAAVRIVGALRKVAPNATTSQELAGHLGHDRTEIDAALDLLAALGAVDTVPRGDVRIARLSARLRLRGADVPVVGLS